MKKINQIATAVTTSNNFPSPITTSDLLFPVLAILTTHWTERALSFYASTSVKQFLTMITKYAASIIAKDFQVSSNEALIFA